MELNESSQQRLMGYALRLLGGKNYTVKELTNKLVGKEKCEPSDVSNVIEKLLYYGYIDDKKYAQSYIREHSERRPKGIRLIAKNLELKGIDKEVIEEAIKNANINEYPLAIEIAKKKAKTLLRYEEDQRFHKLFRFLISRGFQSSTALKASKTVL